jgi:serine/threonine protein phosphatase 1
MPGLLTYAIGDIHGTDSKLASLLEHCLNHADTRPFRLVFLGDYVDRGPGSRQVVDSLIKLQTAAPQRIICLKGNHEDMLMSAVRGDDGPWLHNGGGATLTSYGVRHVTELPAEHLEWFASLPFAIADQKRFFVHAGIKPGIPLHEQSKADLLWIREPFLLDPRDHGLYVVHGHTPIPAGVPELRRNRLNLDTGAYFGGPLTAAVFDETTAGPLAFLTDDGTVVRAATMNSLQQA